MKILESTGKYSGSVHYNAIHSAVMELGRIQSCVYKGVFYVEKYFLIPLWGGESHIPFFLVMCFINEAYEL